MIDNQINLFAQDEETQSFESWLQDICFRVLDENTTEHKHVIIRKNKGYNALIYRNRIVFTYFFAKDKNWVNFPIRYAKYLPSDGHLEQRVKSDKITISVDGESQAKQLAASYAAALNEAIDNGPREYSCCSRYQECSNAGKCVNPYPDIAIECRYKINLKHGRNFYKTKA